MHRQLLRIICRFFTFAEENKDVRRTSDEMSYEKCIRKAAAAVLSAALLVTSESPAFAQNIQQTAVPADVITEQSRLEDGIVQTGYISDSFSEKRQEVQKEDTEGLLKSAAEQLPGQYRTQQLPAVRNQGGYGTCWAFSTIACMEINLMKKVTGKRICRNCN